MTFKSNLIKSEENKEELESEPMGKEIDLENKEELDKFIVEFDTLYDLKTVILIGRETGVRRIDLDG